MATDLKNLRRTAEMYLPAVEACFGPALVIELIDRLEANDLRFAQLEDSMTNATKVLRERKEETERAQARSLEYRDALAKIASLLFEPVSLPVGMPGLLERIVGAIEQLYRERTDARTGEHAMAEECARLTKAYELRADAAEKRAEEAERQRDAAERAIDRALAERDAVRAEVQRLTRERDARPSLATLPTEFVAGEWIMSGQAEPDAVVTYASEPSPETGHVGWCWWARGKTGEARDYMAAREAAERSLRTHARKAGGGE